MVRMKVSLDYYDSLFAEDQLSLQYIKGSFYVPVTTAQGVDGWLNGRGDLGPSVRGNCPQYIGR